MIETFAALLLAHAAADFLFQPAGWVASKTRPATLLKHGAVVLGLNLAATGAAHPMLAGLAVAHLAIDVLKARLSPPGLGAFIADQVAHLATLAVAAVLAPGLWQGGLWADRLPMLPTLATYTAGAIIAIRAGQFAVALLMQAQGTPEPPAEGLPQGGTVIGLMERGLIFVLILAGELAAIGFLIAAKSVLRFGAVGESRAASEYVIIGTLASFGWAIVAALATRALAEGLPPIEIVPFHP